MSVKETVAAVSQAAEKATAAGACLQQAGQAAEEAGQALAQATQGSADQEVGQAVGLLAEAVRGASAFGQLTAKVSGDLSAYVKSLTGDQGQDESGRQAFGPAAPSSDREDEPVDLVKKLRRELPPPVAGRRGVKTQGRWFAPGKNATAIASGRDDRTDRVDEILNEAGCDRRPVTAAADVELKLAAEMRDKGITDASVVINNVPCTGKTSCDGLLGIVLPEGSALTVYGANGFKKVYQGGAKWQW